MKHLHLLLALAGCSSSGPSLDRATIGSLVYGVPSGWSSRDLSLHHPMFEWMPPVDANDDKESLVVLRADRPAMARATPAKLGKLVLEAQQRLPSAAFGRPKHLSTKSGFAGVRIEGAFQPANQATPYHRIHAVLADGNSLVHVIYTAREPDREAFDAVVESFRASHGE